MRTRWYFVCKQAGMESATSWAWRESEVSLREGGFGPIRGDIVRFVNQWKVIVDCIVSKMAGWLRKCQQAREVGRGRPLDCDEQKWFHTCRVDWDIRLVDECDDLMADQWDIAKIYRRRSSQSISSPKKLCTCESLAKTHIFYFSEKSKSHICLRASHTTTRRRERNVHPSQLSGDGSRCGRVYKGWFSLIG
jgi:hypothetical protein